MARTSPLYYVAPSAISITPNANGSSRDLAVYVARGTKVKVYDPRIAALGMGENSTFQEWTLTGRNRRLADSEIPYTIYARLTKADEKTGYLVFAAQTHPDGSDEWLDPYVLSPNVSSYGGYHAQGADGITYPWSAIPMRQAEDGRSDYWWIKLGTLSAPDESGQRTIDLDTGILGTDQYNSQWHLNPDDLPDKEVRYIMEDRGQWTATPKVIYTGPTGQRTPDGTLDGSVATSLGWTGEEPLSFTQGQEIDEPYHYRSLTRLRWLTQRLSADNADYTDADLYFKLTGTTKGWEVENTLETSRVWNYGILWECADEGETQTPRWGSAVWQAVGGNNVYTGEITTPNGRTFRNGNVDTTLSMRIWYGTEEITERIVLLPDFSATWKRSTDYDTATDTFVQQSEDLSWVPTAAGATTKIKIVRGDMGSGWMINYRQALISCTASFSAEGQTISMPADYVF